MHKQDLATAQLTALTACVAPLCFVLNFSWALLPHVHTVMCSDCVDAADKNMAMLLSSAGAASGVNFVNKVLIRRRAGISL